MRFVYSRQNLSKNEQRLERALEIVPGALSWSILISMVLLCAARPLAAAVAIIACQVFWLFRLVYMTFFLWLSCLRLSLDKETDCLWCMG